jgi:predicted metalloprotease with PDZ domain
MNKTFLTLCWILASLSGCSVLHSSKFGYDYKIDLNKIDDEKLSVELAFSGNLADTSHFCFPKIIPGIYDALDYGKFINDLEAYNNKGQALKISRVDSNCWKVSGAKSVASIRYKVDDGWENFDFKGIRPYRSSESHFDRDVVILNTNAVFGYFSQYEHLPFRISVNKPENFYGATSLTKASSSKTEDQYIAPNYRALVDSPMMYSLPDTTRLTLPGISVNVASYSTSKEKIANELAQHIASLVTNQVEYLGGKLATDNYTFIIYHSRNTEDGMHFADGLEHNQSTLVLMYAPLDMDVLKKDVFNLVSHEFFHTLIPLGLHSHEIANFDFNNPTFSKHLWLYEGMTEYFTIHMPAKQRLVTLDEFIRTIESKIAAMRRFDNTVAFTELSKNVMLMSDQYMNFYSKGALINLCLDIELRRLSNGAYGVQNLVLDLMERYGKEKPFNDDDLFNDMVEITGHPEVKTFIEKYIEGIDELPLKEVLERVGLNLDVETGKISEIKPMSEAQMLLRQQWVRANEP